MSAQPAMSLRRAMLLLAVGTSVFVGAITLQVVLVLSPAAAELRTRGEDLLTDHDIVVERLGTLRRLRRAVADQLQPGQAQELRETALDSLRRVAERELTASNETRGRIERSRVPLEMLVQLAQAGDQEALAAVRVLDAIREIRLGETEDAGLALRAADRASEEANARLVDAERIAIQELLRGEDRLVGQLGALQRWSGVWVMAGLLLLALGVRFARDRFYLPVRAMEQGVARIATGQLETQIPVWRNDELGILAAHINEMTAVLRDRAAEETRARESLTERFGRVLDESANEIGIFDAESLALLQANRGLRVALGFSPEDLAGRHLLDLIAGLDDTRMRGLLQELRNGTQERVLLTVWLRRKDGSIRPAEVALQLSSGGGAPVFILVAEDAGVRQRVRALDERLRTFVSREQEALSSGELDRALPPIVQLATEALDAARSGIWQHLNGDIRPLATWAPPDGGIDADAPYPNDQMRPVLRADVRSGARVIAELAVEAEYAERTWTTEERAFLGNVADLVSRAFEAHERRNLEQALERAQRMDSIGQLAGGVAHDFNNILTAILGNLEACRIELTPGAPMDTALAEAQLAALRAADLTRQLLTFARRQVVETTAVDVALRTRDGESMLRRLIGPEITLSLSLDEPLGTVRLGAGQLEQLLVNLVVNARDAMASGGRIDIRVQRRRIEPADLSEFPGLTPGDFVELLVSDTGIGMDPQTVERVFEPFYTTKRVGEGTGLGLAVCYGIARNAGGSISVTSALGHGTTFRILLPSVAHHPSPALGLRQLEGSAGARILLAEDEPAIRTLLVRMLAGRGLRVTATGDGTDALAAAEESPVPFDVLLTDVVMPRMGGVELARAMRARQPGLPILFMSGYTATTSLQLGEFEDAGFVSKPFTPDEVMRRLNKLLPHADTSEPLPPR